GSVPAQKTPDSKKRCAMRKTAKTVVAACLAFVCAGAGRADVVLSVSRLSPTTVRLSWTGGPPAYQVFRAAVAPNLRVPANIITTTSAGTFDDSSAAGSVLFYAVTEGHCLSASDCPPSGGECSLAVCETGTCGTQNLPAGTVLPNQTVGDCRIKECDQ